MSVYNGDVSDTILSKLSAYYNENAPINTPYAIYRPDQYEYILVYGQTSDYHSWTDCRVVRYFATQSGYNQAYLLDVEDRTTYTADLSGYTGYIYSSSDQFIPSRYIGNDRISTFFLCGIFAAVILFSLSTFISALICGRKSQ